MCYGYTFSSKRGHTTAPALTKSLTKQSMFVSEEASPCRTTVSLSPRRGLSSICSRFVGRLDIQLVEILQRESGNLPYLNFLFYQILTATDLPSKLGLTPRIATFTLSPIKPLQITPFMFTKQLSEKQQRAIIAKLTYTFSIRVRGSQSVPM